MSSTSSSGSISRMNRYLGTSGKAIRFVSLTVALLMTAVTVTNLFFGAVWLALCSAVIAGYAGTIFFEAMEVSIKSRVDDEESSF